MKEKEIKQIKKLLDKYLKNIEIKDVCLKQEESEIDNQKTTNGIIYITLSFSCGLIRDAIVMCIDYKEWASCKTKERDQVMMCSASQVARLFAKRLFLKELKR